jgi:hypothetical protein
MTETDLTDLTLPDAIAQDGYAFVPAPAMRVLLAQLGSLADWQAFADSWSDLALDGHMADQGRYRRRRHAVYRIEAGGTIRREPHQPHFQTVDYNPLNGGVARWFEPVTPAIGSSASLLTILRFCQTLFGRLAPETQAWHVEIHQFRIEARADMAGRPTPEGSHRDGVDYVLVLLIDRRNIASGTTTIHGLDRSLLGSFTLTHPFDAALVEDTRVYHGVTPVEPLDATQAAYRDVLVVTFRKVPAD